MALGEEVSLEVGGARGKQARRPRNTACDLNAPNCSHGLRQILNFCYSALFSGWANVHMYIEEMPDARGILCGFKINAWKYSEKY